MTTRCLLLLITLAVFCLPAPVLAQAGDSDTGTAMRVFDHFLVKGGAITWFLLVPLSVATVAMALQHFWSIRRATFVPRSTFETVAELLRTRRY